jgi:hypothetical protein
MGRRCRWVLAADALTMIVYAYTALDGKREASKELGDALG